MVITIIGIILALVLVAGMDAANRANERATQSLITKLEQGVNDRLEALLQYRPQANFSHGYLAGIYSSLAVDGTKNPLGMLPPQFIFPDGNLLNKQINPAIIASDRAQVIAWNDFIKSEMPDVFYVQNTTPGTHDYPLNFAGVSFLGSFVLPLGSAVTATYGDNLTTNPSLGPAGSGIYGASYAAAAGIYKGLGYVPAGYDGVDNDGDGFIDNWGEGVTTANQVQVSRNLLNHTHVTARAEMLYALLVEGSGPLGSVFSRDDFTGREVQDTDGDGMPEFVDAWNQPIQFFRWPVYYHSDLQRGQNIVPAGTAVQTWNLIAPYTTMLEQREQDPLDPNQQLMAPAWWATTGNGGIATNNSFPTALVPFATAKPTNASFGVQAFEALFHPLTEPLVSTGGATDWDRGATYPSRRAFYSKFLILSGGPDQAPGVFLYADADLQTLGAGAASYLIANENNAMPFALDLFANGTAGFTTSATIGTTSFTYGPSNDPTRPSSYDLLQSGADDISNHNLQTGGAIGGSG